MADFKSRFGAGAISSVLALVLFDIFKASGSMAMLLGCVGFTILTVFFIGTIWVEMHVGEVRFVQISSTRRWRSNSRLVIIVALIHLLAGVELVIWEKWFDWLLKLPGVISVSGWIVAFASLLWALLWHFTVRGGKLGIASVFYKLIWAMLAVGGSLIIAGAVLAAGVDLGWLSSGCLIKDNVRTSL